MILAKNALMRFCGGMKFSPKKIILSKALNDATAIITHIFTPLLTFSNLLGKGLLIQYDCLHAAYLSGSALTYVSIFRVSLIFIC